MTDEVVGQILRVLAASPSVKTLDITGGAPEMNAAFRPLVEGASQLGLEVIDRCNLTVLCEPSMCDPPPRATMLGACWLRTAVVRASESVVVCPPSPGCIGPELRAHAIAREHTTPVSTRQP